MRILILSLLWLSTPVLAANWVASIEPLAMVARAVLGDDAEVSTLLLPNQTPHFAAFTPAQLQQVRGADVVIWLGAEAEPQLQSLLAKQRGTELSVLALPGVLRRAGGDDDNAHKYGAHDHDEHAHAGLDPHLWLSVDNMATLARAIATRAVAGGAEEAAINQRRDSFIAALLQWRQSARQQLAPYQQTPWLSQHDPWGYFAESLNLQPPLRVSNGLQSSTSSRHFSELMQQMRNVPVHCVVREPEAQRALLARLCQQDCKIVDLDPLGRDRVYGGYLKFIETLTQGFADCLSASAP